MVYGSWLKDGWGPSQGPGAAAGPKNPEIMKIEVWRFSNNKIEKWLIQNEPEQFRGAFKPIFFINIQWKKPQKRQKRFDPPKRFGSGSGFWTLDVHYAPRKWGGSEAARPPRTTSTRTTSAFFWNLAPTAE